MRVPSALGGMSVVARRRLFDVLLAIGDGLIGAASPAHAGGHRDEGAAF